MRLMVKRKKNNNDDIDSVLNFDPFNLNNPFTIDDTKATPKLTFDPKDYEDMVSMDQIEKEIKHLDGGKSKPQMPGYRYKTPKTKRHKAGDKVPANEDVTTPSGEHWKKGTETVSHKVQDYEQSDIFSDFDGNFFLEKIGNKFHCWIQVKTAPTIDVHGQPGASSSLIPDRKICDSMWTDESGHKSFALSSIAAHFAKHNIYEDTTDDPHVYNDINMGCGAVKYWNILDGGYTDDNKPRKIAHAGETIVIDTSRMKVKKTDGTDLTPYTSFGSMFPPLYGSRINQVDFFPTVGTGCDVNVMYVPRIK